MKILFVSHEKKRNGSTVSMITLIDALKKKYECDICVLIPGHGEAEEELKKHCIPYHIIYYHPNYRRIKYKEPIKNGIKEFVNITALFRIKHFLQREKFDFVCSNSSAVDVAARVAIKIGIPHIYYIREFMEEDFSFEYRNKKRMRSLLESSDKIIFISKAIENKYVSLYKLKSYKTFYNGIDTEHYYLKDNEILTRDRLELIQIGSFSDGKGTFQTIEFVNSIKDDVNCKLTLVGYSDGVYLNRLIQYIKQNHLESYVSIISYTTNIKGLFKNKDIIVINSHFEAFGRVTVEGMLGGLLVLGRDAAGTSEIVAHNETGLLFKNGNEFRSCIHKINENRDFYRNIALAGQKMACEKYKPSYAATNFITYIWEKQNEN